MVGTNREGQTAISLNLIVIHSGYFQDGFPITPGDPNIVRQFQSVKEFPGRGNVEINRPSCRPARSKPEPGRITFNNRFSQPLHSPGRRILNIKRCAPIIVRHLRLILGCNDRIGFVVIHFQVSRGRVSHIITLAFQQTGGNVAITLRLLVINRYQGQFAKNITGRNSDLQCSFRVLCQKVRIFRIGNRNIDKQILRCSPGEGNYQIRGFTLTDCLLV